jgi:hypothetical protein
VRGACARRGAVRRAWLLASSASRGAARTRAASSSAAFGGLLGAVPLFARASAFRLELGGDLRVVLGAQIDLLDGGAVRFASGSRPLLALEGLDLLDGDFELVGDPRVGTTLSHPPADLVKLRTQGPAAHRGRS